jgi:ring-1,2-phenylacetyl-CoA epoxidase subunit PaaD
MVTTETVLARARSVAATVCDPEIPGLSIADLGVLRDVALVDGQVEVRITPTYSGCPAMHAITQDIQSALTQAGIAPAQVRLVLSPAWSTDMITPAGRAHLAALGIVPPPRAGTRRDMFGASNPACPRCGSADTETLSEFGSTACKSLHRCHACREPFDAFKCH